MSWKKEVDELSARRAMAEKMGGEEKVARQHSRGKMDATLKELQEEADGVKHLL